MKTKESKRGWFELRMAGCGELSPAIKRRRFVMLEEYLEVVQIAFEDGLISIEGKNERVNRTREVMSKYKFK